jgi:RNA polymerase sigma-70 factor (ECF subfamily)
MVAADQPDLPDGLERRVMRSQLAELPAEQRDALFLAYYADMTAEQIAIRRGVPVGTVKGRLRLGLAKLRGGAAEPATAAAA